MEEAGVVGKEGGIAAVGVGGGGKRWRGGFAERVGREEFGEGSVG